MSVSANIIQLRDRERTDASVSFYPITITEAIIDSSGMTLDSKLAHQIDNNIININRYNNHPEAYETKSDARNALNTNFKRDGICVTYLTADGWHIEKFNGNIVTDWNKDTSWANMRNPYVVLTEDEYTELIDSGDVNPDTMYLVIEENE
jgi:hypothetical protein